MTAHDLIDILAPMAAGLIMLGTGMGITIRILAEAIGDFMPLLMIVVLQVVAMPLAAFAVAWVAGLSPELSMGLLLLSACPTTAIAVMFTDLSKGDARPTTLGLVLTTLGSMASMSLLLHLGMRTFLGVGTPVQLPMAPLFQALAVHTVLPLTIGMVYSALSETSKSMAPLIKGMGLLAVIALTVAIIVAEFDVLMYWIPRVAGACIALCAIMSSIAALLAWLLEIRLPPAAAVTQSMAFKDTYLATAVLAGLFSGQAAYVAPAIVYGLVQLIAGTVIAVIYRRAARA